jgi:hypothetical protein
MIPPMIRIRLFRTGLHCRRRWHLPRRESRREFDRQLDQLEAEVRSRPWLAAQALAEQNDIPTQLIPRAVADPPQVLLPGAAGIHAPVTTAACPIPDSRMKADRPPAAAKPLHIEIQARLGFATVADYLAWAFGPLERQWAA